MNRFFTNIFLMAITLLFFSVLSTEAATITVNTLVDENDTNNSACSLREAINNANGDNTTDGLGCVAGSGTDAIVISVNGTITPTTALPTITSSLSITGNGASLLSVSGNDAFRVFVISSGTVSINNMTVTDGFDSVQAGCIYNSGGTVTLSGLVVTNCVASQAGGVQTDASMAITGSTFINNSSTGPTFSGGAFANFGPVTITNSTFSNNTAGNSGGAMALYANSNISNSTFSDNQSPIGGGIQALAGSGTCTNCTFTRNVAPTGSGAVAVENVATFNLTNSTIVANRGGAGTAAGGLSVANTSIVLLTNTIIAGNTNNNATVQTDIRGTGILATSSNNLIGTGGSGGLTNGVNGNQVGVSMANARVLPLGDYGGTVQTMPIRTNSPARNAGINTGAPATDARGFNRPQATTVDIGAFEIQTNSVVTNTANSGAGSLRDVVSAIPANEIVQFDTPLFNTAQTISLSGGQITLTQNVTIYGNGANLLTVRNTAAASSTSRVFNVSNLLTVTFDGLAISGGTSTNGGSGISTTSGTVTVNNCYIHSNSTTTYGAGIRNNSGTLIINNTTISNNIANSDADATDNVGGAIDSSGTLLMNNSTISGNSVLGTGTGMSGGVYTTTATITGSTITNNSAPTGANASGLRRSGGTVTVRNSIIAGNVNNSTVPDVLGAFTSGGYNLIGNRGTASGFTAMGDQTGSSSLIENRNGESLAPTAILDPLLFALSSNGGTVPTHASMAGSPLVDKGNAFGLTTDTRGLARTVDLVGYTNVSDGTDIGAFEAQLAPTSSSVSVSGRVLTADGSGIRNARVQISDRQGGTMTVLTTSFGYFRFDDVPVGATYVVSVASKRFNFTPRVLTLAEELSDVDFIGDNGPSGN